MTETATDFLAMQDRERTLASIRAAADQGQRLSGAERKALWADRLAALDKDIRTSIKAGKVADALRRTIIEIATTAIGAAERADRLEDRIAALEPDAKPRVRRQALSRPRT